MLWRRYLPLLFCGLFLPLCIPLIRPFVASGMNDDWAYMQTASALFHTGHIVYNGWSAPILGWQLYFSDLLMHLFGFSYTAMRMGTMLIGIASAFSLLGVFARSGVRISYALLAVFTIMASPLFLPLAFSYMTDIYGLFSLSLCLLLCMRAVQAESDGAALLWLCGAILENAITGSTRQVAWLGVLVMCPSAIWLVRDRKRVVLPALAVMLTGWVFVAGCLHWFSLQPYVQSEEFSLAMLHSENLMVLLRTIGRVPLEMVMLTLPVLVPFALALPRKYAVRLGATACAFGLLVAASYVALHRSVFLFFLFPYLTNYVTVHGTADGTYLHGVRPVVLGAFPRILWTMAGLFFGGAFLLVYRDRRSRQQEENFPASFLSWRQLNVLLLPFLCVYTGLLIPRSLTGGMFDRYLLLYFFPGMIYLFRFYQERVPAQRLWPSWLLVAVMGTYGVAVTHDAFEMHRARLAAVQELLGAHIDPTAIDGGFEYNGQMEIERVGFLHAPRMRETKNYPFPFIEDGPQTCVPQWIGQMPTLHAKYALSFQQDFCGGFVGFAPVTYHAWLGPHQVPVYIIGLNSSH